MSIEVKKLAHIYSPNTPFESRALEDINLKIEDGEFIGLIGHTGSGKSTFIQHLNGLLEPSEGEILIDEISISKGGMSKTELRKKVGLLFQYPEYQLFEETIEKDIAFGPKNLKLSKEEIKKRVKDAMEFVGLDYETFKDRNPFELSGGQKRRVAIAGIIAMEPNVLILDEPTAGLDPKVRTEIFNQIKALHKKKKNTIILVSHSMEDTLNLAEKIIVMYKGRVKFFGTPEEVFNNSDELTEIGLDLPDTIKLRNSLNQELEGFSSRSIKKEELKKELLDWMKNNVKG